MLHALSRPHRFAGLLLCFTLLTTMAFTETPKTLGYLDSQDVLVFEGNATFTKDQICDAIYSDRDVILAIGPTAPLQAYLKTLEAKITLGYLNKGFCSPTVNAAYVVKTEQIKITIDEGPRYTKGKTVIKGASDELKETLTQYLSVLVIEAGESSMFAELFDGKPNTIPQKVSPDEIAAFEEMLKRGVHQTFLGSNGFPSFAPSLPKTSKDYLDHLLELLGYYHCTFTVELVPDHALKTAAVHITFQDEGVRAQAATIDIVGNRINSDKQIQNFLELKAGQPINKFWVQTLQIKLADSGRFRLATVQSEINKDQPAQSILHIFVEELDGATALDSALTDEEALMQKVGQFMGRYQSWEQDVQIRLNLEKAGEEAREKITSFEEKYGVTFPIFEIIFSPKRGLMITLMTNETPVNTPLDRPLQLAFVYTPQKMYFFNSALKQRIHCDSGEQGLSVMIEAGPNEQVIDGQKWHIQMGMGFDSDVEDYLADIKFHPAVWFDMANNPKTSITPVDQSRVRIQTEYGAEIAVDPRTGEIIEVRWNEVAAKFEKGLFEARLETLEKAAVDADCETVKVPSFWDVLTRSSLSLYLTHLPTDKMALEQKTEALRALNTFLSGFAECRSEDDDTDDSDNQDTFMLPMDEQLAADGMLPMVMGYAYRICQENLPRDSWVRTLMHSLVLMSSGYAQHPSVSQDLQYVYNSDEIGPVGYLLTAQLLGQLHFPAYQAFAQRGLAVLDAEHFRKDWQPLLVRESEIKTQLLCYLKQFQTSDGEDIRLVELILPKYAAQYEDAAEKLRQVQIDKPIETLDPVLTDYWQTMLKENIQQQLNELLGLSQAAQMYPPAESTQTPRQPESGASNEQLSELEKRAEAGDLNALVQRGLQYIESAAENPQDYSRAVTCFKMAAEKGHADGQYNLGRMYYYGIGVKKDYSEALQWYTKAGRQEHARALYELCVMHGNGQGVERDDSKSVEYCRRSAELGFAFAQNWLGELYGAGNKVPRDYAECFKWLTKSAEQGYSKAQYNLGAMYMEGLGVDKDHAKAAQWYQKAAEQNFPMALYNMGVMYLNGWGVEQDYAEAVKWWHKAAEMGLAIAQLNLGKAYQQGDGVKRDYAQSLKWFNMAALQQYPGAWNEMGLAYENGWGVERDYAKAFEYFMKGIADNAGYSEYNLARLYSLGLGTETDYVQAYKWLLVAGVNGQSNEPLEQSLKEKMTEKQTAEGRRLASEYLERKAEATSND